MSTTQGIVRYGTGAMSPRANPGRPAGMCGMPHWREAASSDTLRPQICFDRVHPIARADAPTREPVNTAWTC